VDLLAVGLAGIGFPVRRISLIAALLVILGYVLRQNLNRRSKDRLRPGGPGRSG
jgi:hypothetical protein